MHSVTPCPWHTASLSRSRLGLLSLWRGLLRMFRRAHTQSCHTLLQIMHGSSLTLLGRILSILLCVLLLLLLLRGLSISVVLTLRVSFAGRASWCAVCWWRGNRRCILAGRCTCSTWRLRVIACVLLRLALWCLLLLCLLLLRLLRIVLWERTNGAMNMASATGSAHRRQ